MLNRLGLRRQLRLRSLLIVVAVAALVLAGLARWLRTPARPYSTVFAQFEPAALVWPHAGYTVRAAGPRGGGTFNTVSGYAYREWHGVIEATDDPALPQTFVAGIAAFMKAASQNHSSAWGDYIHNPAPDPQLPSHSHILFNQAEWHGEVQIWLFPMAERSATRYGYAIFLREDRQR